MSNSAVSSGRKTFLMFGAVLFLAVSGFVAGSANAQGGRVIRATSVAVNAPVSVTFSEPISFLGPPLALYCERSGDHATVIQGDGPSYTFTPAPAFVANETCSAVLRAETIADQDTDDPPNLMYNDYAWSFTTPPPPLLINEVDPFAATDAAEFIELYDGGVGHTSLNGLTLVFYRGDEDVVYLAASLGGYATDSRGYFVAGASASATTCGWPMGRCATGRMP